ncbi:MAG: hypothetical protein MZU95_04575 [Desulfomicrobium escambiense]|nr:hypothetical protein [Desulfomicrobium escambiense]
MADAHVKGLKGARREGPGPGRGAHATRSPSARWSSRPSTQKPDGIVFACNAEKIAKIIKELKGRGWTEDGPACWSSQRRRRAELYATGGADINGVQVYNYINPDLGHPALERLQGGLHEGPQRHGCRFSLSTNYYDALYMIKEAIEKTGVTGDPKKLKEERKKIADYCANVQNFQGLMFKWDMQAGVPTNKPLYLLEIEGGKKKMVQEVRPEHRQSRAVGVHTSCGVFGVRCPKRCLRPDLQFLKPVLH